MGNSFQGSISLNQDLGRVWGSIGWGIAIATGVSVCVGVSGEARASGGGRGKGGPRGDRKLPSWGRRLLRAPVQRLIKRSPFHLQNFVPYLGSGQKKSTNNNRMGKCFPIGQTEVACSTPAMANGHQAEYEQLEQHKGWMLALLFPEAVTGISFSLDSSLKDDAASADHLMQLHSQNKFRACLHWLMPLLSPPAEPHAMEQHCTTDHHQYLMGPEPWHMIISWDTIHRQHLQWRVPKMMSSMTGNPFSSLFPMMNHKHHHGRLVDKNDCYAFRKLNDTLL